MNIQIRPGLELAAKGLPGSRGILLTYPGQPPCFFNPADRSWSPYRDFDLASILSQIAEEDLPRIEARLLEYDAFRRNLVQQSNPPRPIPPDPTLAFSKAVFEFIPDGKPADFWVVTAYNPKGKATDADENQAADAKLRAELEAQGLTAFRVIGLSADETHAEPGWGFSSDESTVIGIARRFRQLAVFHFTAGRIDLVDCESGLRESLDHPANRILDPRQVRQFTLWVGTPGSRTRHSVAEIQAVRDLVGARFPGFSIQHAEGSFHSAVEGTLLIHIATRESRKVIALAHDLRRHLSQFGIGLSHNGIYQRVREWADDELILQSFDIAGSPQNLDAPEG